jgi:chromosome segregation ATPase
MTIDIKATLEEISRLEKLQAQVELRGAQIKEEERLLREKLKGLGLTPAELEPKIKELESSIASKLALIRSLDQAVEGIPNGEEQAKG